MRNNLRHLRDGKGWTLKQMAEKTNGQYAFQTIAAYEKKTDDLPAEFLEVMAKVLGVSQESILTPEPAEQPYALHDAPRGQSSFDAVAGLSDEQLVQIISGLANELQTATGEARFKKIMSLSIHANALLVRATEAMTGHRSL